MIPHLRGREQALESFGWSRQETEWITLVCLHSGIFTRRQFCAYFKGTGSRWEARARRFVEQLTRRKFAVQEPIEGLPTTTLPCRIASKSIYRALGIPNVRHRRRGGASVVIRRLVSLDYVLQHPALPWLPTEDEKVSALDALNIPRRLYPKRRYASAGGSVTRYFFLKLPIAIGEKETIFVYTDPGRDTDHELLQWGAMHGKLWEALRTSGRQVHVIAASRDPSREDRAKQVLLRWTRTGPGPASSTPTPEERRDIERIEHAVDTFDMGVLREYGGLRKAMNYRQGLIQRPNGDAPKARIRITQGQTWLSPRLPSEDELW